MKYLRFLISCCFSMLAALTMADNVTVDNASVLAGEEKLIEIGLNNTESDYVSCQFDIVLPEGFSIPTDGVSLDGARCGSHQFNYVQVSDGKYRVMIYSMPVKPFSGNSGTIVNLKLQCDNSVKAGTYGASITAQKFTDSEGQKHILADCQFSIEVKSIVVKANSYSRKYGEENLPFGYMTDATLNGTPEIVCEATVTSPVGKYPIKVLKGSVTNSNVEYVDGELVIEEAPLVISADNKQMVWGDPIPEFTATYEGFKNGEVASGLKKQPQFSCSATESSEPGEYAISILGAEAQNYAISYVNGTLTIVEPQAVVVTVNNVSRKYGESNPAVFEYTVEGGTIIGEPTISCNATQSSPVGEYDITIARGSVTNNNVSFVKGTLTVEKATLTIKADDKEMIIGNPLPEYTVTYQGFKNNETEVILTKKPEFGCNATPTSAGGNYPISVFGAEARNYDFVYESGMLTIVDPPLTVTVTNCEREYGENNPLFSYSVTGGKLIGEPLLKTEATKESQAGSYGITIEQGNVLNANVTYVGGTMKVKKAPLEIKVNDITIRQGEVIPLFTATYRGFKLTDNESLLQEQPKFTCEVTSSSQAGEYTISVSGAKSNNYEFSYINGVLRVVESPVIVKVNDKVREYGEENPVFDYTVEGGELKGTPVVRCEAKRGSTVGEYEIVIEKGTVTNKEVTFLNGRLWIEKAPLTITADNKEIVLGEAIPEFTATYTGFKNGEALYDLEQTPHFSCSASQNSDPGEYVIEVFGAHSLNYAINYVNGTLIIRHPDPVIAVISNPVAGQLASQIEAAGFSTKKVNEMKVTGLLNGTDIKCIREMIIKGGLTVLDIQETSIVSGGEPYYGEGLLEQRTENNVIGQFMFYDCQNLSTIKLPNTVTLIEYAFDGCDNLLRLDIPLSCEKVGTWAISQCPSLNSITIPAATKEFDSANCLLCPSLKSIEVDSSNKWFSSVDGVLYSHDMVELIKYPMGKMETSFDVPKSVVTINDFSFSDALFTSVVLPEGVLSIGSGAFSYCDNLVEIEIPQSVVSIDMSAFSDCKNLNSIVLPDGLTEVSDFLASYCKSLSYLCLSRNITKIGYAAFGSCESLSRIDCYIPDITSVQFGTDYYTGKVNAFDGTPNNCTWHVLPGTSNNYRIQSWWVDSWNIIEDLEASQIRSPYSNLKNKDIWYTIDGKRVNVKSSQNDGDKNGEGISKGIYIVNGRKIMVY